MYTLGSFGGDNDRQVDVTCVLPEHDHGSGSLEVVNVVDGINLPQPLSPVFTPGVVPQAEFVTTYSSTYSVTGRTSYQGTSDPVSTIYFDVKPLTYYTNYYICIGY